MISCGKDDQLLRYLRSCLEQDSSFFLLVEKILNCKSSRSCLQQQPASFFNAKWVWTFRGSVSCGGVGTMLLLVGMVCVCGCRDNHMLLQLLFLLAAHSWLPGFSNLPMWNMRGLIILLLLHAGPVEFLYYWIHRAFHSQPLLFQSYHSFHHLSVVTEPPTGQSH